MLSAILREARPVQWLKNALVFAAPVAAGVLLTSDGFKAVLLAFVSMCLAASGTYVFNDIIDVKSDRQHPTKRFRPIAAGEIPMPLAIVIGAALLLGAPAVMALTGQPRAVATVVVYILVTLSYSALWKNIAVLDLIVIASGFVLRAIAGGFATDVPMSSWFLLVTAFGSLFVVTGKRYAEANQLGADAEEMRATLGEYTANFLRFVLGVSCSAALICYCLWAFDVKSTIDPEWPMLELSVVPILASFLRYALVLEKGEGAAPEDVFSTDRVLQGLGLVWLALFAGAVYL